MPHTHSHAGRSDSHQSTSSARSSQQVLVWALIITLVFMIAEAVGAYLSNSLALLADAGHMLSDVAALGLSLFAVRFSQRPATPARTYGYFRGEILAALLNGATLIVISLWIIYEAYQRALFPPKVKSGLMIIVAAVGLLANMVCVWVLRSSQSDNLNVRAAFLHVAGDVLGSIGALTAGLIMWKFQWYLADPIFSVLVSLLILYSSWHLVKEAVEVLLEGTPSHINITAMRQELATVQGVQSIHDLHVWTLTSGVHMMSCHAVIDKDENPTRVLKDLSRLTQDKFRISHTTIQVEEPDMVRCDVGSCH
ncbi:MAG TPA: cation diffusion facilitator family transporter [Acidobacteriota bacterium]|jgi:cobalt-zinc-cadmium efflux system protein